MTKILNTMVIALTLAIVGPVTWPAAAGEALLSIETRDGVVHRLDRAAIEAMPRESFTTTTIWTEGPHEFTGVPLKGLLAAYGITEGDIRAVALNEYSVDIPVEALHETAPIVAYLLDGAPFGVRDKGPLWILYPYDLDTAYQSETAYGRSVWHLTRLIAH